MGSLHWLDKLVKLMVAPYPVNEKAIDTYPEQKVYCTVDCKFHVC